MDIIIAGAGKVGFELARVLSSTHNVTVIDKNAEALERLQGLIDIFPVVGDIDNPLTCWDYGEAMLCKLRATSQ